MAKKGRLNLKRTYSHFNRRWFGGRLPKDALVKWSKMRDTIGLCTLYPDRPALIEISRNLRSMSTVAKATLLHECVHLDLACSGSRGMWVEHGAPFQRRMLKLAKAGALAHLW